MVQKVGDVNYTRIVTHNAQWHQKNIWKKKYIRACLHFKTYVPHETPTIHLWVDHWISLLYSSSFTCRTPLINAQWQSILINTLALITMPINFSQFRSLPINSGSRVLWLELISFKRYVFQINSIDWGSPVHVRHRGLKMSRVIRCCRPQPK